MLSENLLKDLVGEKNNGIYGIKFDLNNLHIKKTLVVLFLYLYL